MHNLKQIQDRFGWSYMPARKRVKWLQDNFSSEVKGGNGRKYLVTDNGLTILDRLKQVENDTEDLRSAFEQVKEDIQDNQEGRPPKDRREKDNQGAKDTTRVDQKVDKSELSTGKRYIDRLEAENDYLRDKLDQKDLQLQEANEKIHGFIAGEVRKSPWERFKDWLL